MADDTVVTLAQAKRDGSRHYFTGKPCKHGHIDVRFVSTRKCRACCAQHRAGYREKNKENISRYMAEYRRNNKVKLNAYSREYMRQNDYYSNNRERILQYQRERYVNNRDTILESNSNWRKENPESVRFSKLNFKHKRRQLERKGVSARGLKEWVSQQDKICHYCGEGCHGRYEVDHMVPLSRGGSHDISNFAISCPECNRSKGTKTPEEFAKHQIRLGSHHG